MEYKVEIIRAKRKSLGILVSYDNKIVVRCPRNVSVQQCMRFIDGKKNWLDRVVAKNNAVLKQNADITDYTHIYVGGEKLPLVISDKNAITSAAVYLKSLKHIRQTYIKHFSESFIAEARNISESIKMPANGFFIKAYRARWGCCDSKKNITFNYLLFMLPRELQRYVIIHELCHTVYFNHSQTFWRMVASYVPDYAKLKKQLKKFDFMTKLY